MFVFRERRWAIIKRSQLEGEIPSLFNRLSFRVPTPNHLPRKDLKDLL